MDVSSIDSLTEGFASFSADFSGKLDICVPCAGINRNVSFLDTSVADHQKLLGVNVIGVYHTAQLAAKQMIANGTKCGSIIMVASIASYMAIRSQMSTAYCGTKGAVRAMCPPIAAELSQYVRCHSPHVSSNCVDCVRLLIWYGFGGHQGIRVNSISPGYVRTEMTAPVRSSSFGGLFNI